MDQYYEYSEHFSLGEVVYPYSGYDAAEYFSEPALRSCFMLGKDIGFEAGELILVRDELVSSGVFLIYAGDEKN